MGVVPLVFGHEDHAVRGVDLVGLDPLDPVHEDPPPKDLWPSTSWLSLLVDL